ncbi:MAG: PLP-dependent aminotransferase family protein [Clostridia bacterium]|nr:PLP-dependent aminotransferase family protein [Clostridia bacterium]
MKYRIKPKSGTPAYMQLYSAVKHEIISGAYPYDTRLPSKRMLAEEAGVSVITVEHAYAILADEGYIRAKQKSGYYVSYRETDFLSTFEPAHEATLTLTNLHSPENAFPLSVLFRTMRRVMADMGDRLLVKSPNHGLTELRHAVKNYLMRSAGFSVRAEQIIIGSGAEYLYGLIVQLFGNNSIFALESPSYDKIRKVYQGLGVQCEMLKMGVDGIKTTELARSNASLLHVTPFHSYPTGITASATKRAEYINWARKRNAYIVEDNYDSEFTKSTKAEDAIFSLSKDQNVIYVNTFSGTVAPSIRAGYMVLPEPLLHEFESRLGFYSCTVPVFEQYVLASLIESGDFERHINRVRRSRRRKTKPSNP